MSQLTLKCIPSPYAAKELCCKIRDVKEEALELSSTLRATLVCLTALQKNILPGLLEYFLTFHFRSSFFKKKKRYYKNFNPGLTRYLS